MVNQIWDSTRCMRLLRPLKAHLVALEKEQQRLADLKAARPSPKAPAPKHKSLADSPWINRFVPRQTALKKKTYSNNAKARHVDEHKNDDSSSVSPHMSGELPMPNSFLSNRLVKNAADPYSALAVTALPALPADPSPILPTRTRKSWKPRAFGGVRSEDNLGGLEKSYLAILAATEPIPTTNLCHTPINSGVLSLRTMSVRSMARLIDGEGLMQQIPSADYRTAMAEEVYNELSQVCLQPEFGQPIQAQLVRAQATKMVCDAIRRQILSTAFTFRLVCKVGHSKFETHELMSAVGYAICPNLCRKNCLRDPMYRKIQALVLGTFGLPTKTCDDVNPVPRPAHPLPLNVLRHIIENPYFPIDWLATRMFQSQWHAILLNIASPTAQYYDSRRFVAETFALACGLRPMTKEQQWSLQHIPVLALQRNASPHKTCDECNHRFVPHQKKPREAFTTSISSFLTIITSLLLVGSEGYMIRTGGLGDKISCFVSLENIRSILHQLACEILDKNYDEWEYDKRHTPHLGTRCAYTLFCTLLSEVLQPCASENIGLGATRLIQLMLKLESRIAFEIDEDIGILDGLPLLIVSVCRASAQISNGSEKDILQHIIHVLLGLENISNRPKCFLQHVCRQAALELGLSVDANVASDPGAKDEERYIPKTPATAKKLSSDARQSTMVDYRWEPMLADWVAATPLHLTRAPQPVILQKLCLKPNKLLKVPAVVISPYKSPLHYELTTSNIKQRHSSSEPLETHDDIETQDNEEFLATTETPMYSRPTTTARRFHSVEIPVYVPKTYRAVQRISDLVPSSSPSIAGWHVGQVLSPKPLRATSHVQPWQNMQNIKLRLRPAHSDRDDLKDHKSAAQKRTSSDVDTPLWIRLSSREHDGEKENMNPLRRSKRTKTNNLALTQAIRQRRSTRDLSRTMQLVRDSMDWL